jgi:hypothetical protein
LLCMIENVFNELGEHCFELLKSGSLRHVDINCWTRQLGRTIDKVFMLNREVG